MERQLGTHNPPQRFCRLGGSLYTIWTLRPSSNFGTGWARILPTRLAGGKDKGSLVCRERSCSPDHCPKLDVVALGSPDPALSRSREPLGPRRRPTPPLLWFSDIGCLLLHRLRREIMGGTPNAQSAEAGSTLTLFVRDQLDYVAA